MGEAVLADELVLGVRVRVELVDRDDDGDTVSAHGADVVAHVDAALLKELEVLRLVGLRERISGNNLQSGQRACYDV